MKFRNTLIALIILIGLGVYARCYEKDRAGVEEIKEEKFLVIIDGGTAQNAVTKLELIYKDSSINCSKDKDGNWLLTSQDLRTKGDNDIIAGLIADLKGLRSTRMITENIGSWDNYGLDKPEIKLTVTQKEKPPVTIYFGNKNPAQTAVYARVLEKDILYLIPAWKKNNFKKNLFELREKDVFFFYKNKLKTVALLRPKKKPIIIKPESQDKWKINSPVTARANKEKTDEFLNKLLSLKVKEFIDHPDKDKSKYGLLNPVLRISLASTENVEESLLIGKDSQYASIYGTDTIFLLDKKDIADINKELDYFRSKKIFDFTDTGRVTKFELCYPENKIVCWKSEPENPEDSPVWTLIASAGQKMKADTAEVNTLLRDLYDLEREEKILKEKATTSDTTTYGLDNPLNKIILYLKDTRPDVQVLRVGKIHKMLSAPAPEEKRKKSGHNDIYQPINRKKHPEVEKHGLFYAKSSYSPAVFLLDSKKLAEFQKRDSDLNDKKIFLFKQDKVRRIELIYPEQTLLCHKKGKDKWRLIKPRKEKIDGYKINDIFQELELLEYTAEPVGLTEDLSYYGLDKPDVQIVLKGIRNNILNILTIGKITEQAVVYARIGRASVVYQIDPAKTEIFTKTISELKKNSSR